MIVGLPAVDGDAVEVFSDTGKGDAAAVGGTVTTVLGPQLWGCVRAGCGRGQSSDCFKDHSHTDRPGAERDGRFLRRLETAVVCFSTYYWTEELVCSMMCCHQGGQLLDATSGAMDGRGTCYLFGCAGE